MIREIDPLELEQIAARSIVRGYSREFACAVVNAYRVRGVLGDLLASITPEEENSMDIHEFCQREDDPPQCPAAKDGWCHAD